MKFTVNINKTFEIDTDRDWGGDLDALIDILKENGAEDLANASEIEYALNEMAEDDLDSILGDNGIDCADISIEVPYGTTLKIPAEDEAA